MGDPILHFTTYTAEEAADLLHASVATIHRAIKSGKLQANKFGGKWYRISGEELLKLGGLPRRDKSKERLELVSKFNDSMEELYPLIKAMPGGSMSVFLHQAINLYTCDQDIRKITADVKQFAKKLRRPEFKERSRNIGKTKNYSIKLAGESTEEKNE